MGSDMRAMKRVKCEEGVGQVAGGGCDKDLVEFQRFLDSYPGEEFVSKLRAGSKSFEYMSGVQVKRLANQVFGHGGWSVEVLESKVVHHERSPSGTWTVTAMVTVRVRCKCTTCAERDVFFDGVSTGVSEAKLQKDVFQHAMKAAQTDATKVALRYFGRMFEAYKIVSGSRGAGSLGSAPRQQGRQADSVREGVRAGVGESDDLVEMEFLDGLNEDDEFK